MGLTLGVLRVVTGSHSLMRQLDRSGAEVLSTDLWSLNICTVSLAVRGLTDRIRSLCR
jgi:hypothetical protein